MGEPPPTKRRVLVTGAYGLIGNLVYARLSSRPDSYDVYGLGRSLRPSSRAKAMPFREIPVDRFRQADVSDLGAVSRAVEGIDTVVHLAADPEGTAGWESVLKNNIIGARNVFEAGRLAGVKRIVYGSTNQVVFGYIRGERSNPPPAGPIDHTLPTRPMSYYACGKVFGEALAHMYAFAHGLSCICLRIGWVLPDDRVPDERALGIWCSQRDIVQLIERCITAPESLRFDVFYGQSASGRSVVDIRHAGDVLGYVPQDVAEDHLA